MRFASRQDAGRQLGQRLQKLGTGADLVLGLPRGGVVVAAEVARLLNCPLDALMVRKIGHPWHREFAVGALAEPDVVVLDETSVGKNPMVRFQLDEVIKEETARLQAYRARFHTTTAPILEGKTILLVDDGLATGATAEAAVLSAKRQKARSIVVATPVASTGAVERLAPVADEVVALMVDPDFGAVGQYYVEFDETTDEEVLTLLRHQATSGQTPS
ncbi:MAG TPA: phosphoribosyltransferase family protein [Verrucomicrobiae bacterium]|nr:phosphoribosyltransferase family protein [Verrucomicrobiae bacterium]